MSFTTLSAGKFRAMQTLANDTGHFTMVAVDQRPPLFQALARHGNRDVSEVGDSEISAVKALLVEALAPHCSAILVDPIWAHPDSLRHIPGRTGLISTLEDYAFTERDGERYSVPIANWSVEKIKRSGAVGVKVLAWHRPDLSEAALAHQDRFVEEIGRECARWDIPFILELLIYPKRAEDPSSAHYARNKPRLVLDSLRHFAQPRFGVDLFKLEFPADLKWTKEFASGAFDGRPREAVYDMKEVEGYLQEMDSLSPVPWVLLSAGVGQREFALNIDLAVRAGASGFLAGRAVWAPTLDAYPDLQAVRNRLERESVPFLRSISAAAAAAEPWYEHRSYGGAVTLTDGDRGWHERYCA